MAICAHELTFRDLGKDGFLAVLPPEERADLADFDSSRKMVPRRHGRRKDPPAIGAWLVALEIEIPRREFIVALLLLSESDESVGDIRGRIPFCTICTKPAGRAFCSDETR
jgi:hypothetical protein